MRVFTFTPPHVAKCFCLALFVCAAFAYTSLQAQQMYGSAASPQVVKTIAPNEWIVPIENARMSPRTEEIIKTFKDRRYYKNMQLVSLRSIADTQYNGILAFHVPGDNNQHQAIAQDIEAESKSTYLWTGELLDLPGSMTVVSENDRINAHIKVDGK
ncbi:MAG: hypothetical protein ACLFUB_16590, partial [Cyclobacteriaceae bacterium]